MRKDAVKGVWGGVEKCVAAWGRWGEVRGVKGRIEGGVGKCVGV